MRTAFLWLIVAALFIGLIGCNKVSITGGATVSKSFQPLIPPDTRAVAQIHLSEVLHTPLYKRHESAFNLPMLDEMGERIALNPRRDIRNVLIVWNGKQPLLVADGTFAAKTVEQKLISLGTERSKFGKYNLFGGGKDTVAFFKKSVLIGGRADSVRAGLTTAEQGTGGVPPALRQQLRNVRENDQVWVVSSGGLPFADMNIRSDYESILSNLAGYIIATSAGLAIDSGVEFNAEIICDSEQGARRVHDAVRGAIGLARLTTKGDEQLLLRAFDAIRVNQANDRVTISADLSADLSDQLLAYVPNLRSRAGDMLQQR